MTDIQRKVLYLLMQFLAILDDVLGFSLAITDQGKNHRDTFQEAAGMKEESQHQHFNPNLIFALLLCNICVSNAAVRCSVIFAQKCPNTFRFEKLLAFNF